MGYFSKNVFFVIKTRYENNNNCFDIIIKYIILLMNVAIENIEVIIRILSLYTACIFIEHD